VEERIRTASDLRARLLDVLSNLGGNAEPSARQLPQRLTKQLRTMVPHAASGSTKGRS
jgi:hypothetical protein